LDWQAVAACPAFYFNEFTLQGIEVYGENVGQIVQEFFASDFYV
jgi:hypothetical protein